MMRASSRIRSNRFHCGRSAARSDPSTRAKEWPGCVLRKYSRRSTVRTSPPISAPIPATRPPPQPGIRDHRLAECCPVLERSGEPLSEGMFVHGDEPQLADGLGGAHVRRREEGPDVRGIEASAEEGDLHPTSSNTGDRKRAWSRT